MISEEGENTMAKTKVICFTNNKGGSGKTTTCSNVGFGLRELGKKVLMIDGDMQLNLSLSLFDEDTVLAYAQSDKNLYEAIKRQDDLTDYIVNTKYEGLDLIPSSTLMSSIEYELFTKWQREYILKKGLKKIRESEVYDYILIDAPPTLGGWVMNILCASDYVILPVEASPWGLFGLGNMFEFLDSVEEIAPDLKQIKEVAALESQINDMKADNDARYKQITTSVDLNAIKDAAINRLGMKYASQDQIVYYSIDKNNYMDQYSDIPE